MVASSIEIISLRSVVLTREKQIQIEEQLKKYAASTNFIIKLALSRHIFATQKLIEAAQQQFTEEFDPRAEYLRDVVTTARVTIVQHQRRAHIIRTMQNKVPFFRSGRIIVSSPILRVTDSGVVLFTSSGEPLSIPFDKRSRNMHLSTLSAISNQQKRIQRTRLTRQREGFFDIDIRICV